MTFVRKTLIAGAFGATLALGAAVGVAVADQPFMHSALDNLRDAKRNLENGSDNHGGHRVAALRKTEEAIREVEEGIRWERHH
jgi:hypothetical protein